MQPYTPPSYMAPSFNCPNCGAFAHQIWTKVYDARAKMGVTEVTDVIFAYCVHCNERSIWLNMNMIEPAVAPVPLPNQDLPEDIKKDYLEARDILNKSPRGAAALLRLSVQKLCKHLGEKGKNINDDIGSLVSKGLPVKVQQSLDYLRVIGNEAVHPGQIDLKDDPEVAASLFSVLNLIAEVMITQPKHIENLYNSLPADKLEGIEKRDKKDS